MSDGETGQILWIGSSPTRPGDPLPESALVHRMGSCDPENLVPKLLINRKSGLPKREDTYNPVNATSRRETGFSLLATYDGSIAQEEAGRRAAREFQAKYPRNQATIVGTASVADLRAAGFEVIHDPTPMLPNHSSIYRPDSRWTAESGTLLAGIFKCTSIW